MSIIFEGVEMPTACCFVDKEQIEHCKFYNICKKRHTIKINCKPSDCPVKALEQEPRKGHWTYICNSEVNRLKIVECSECRKRTYGSGNYCPNCGADMREVKE